MKMLPKGKGLLFVISGPSGCGKTTLGKRLLKNSLHLVRSISVTTRPRRKGEKNGREYFFVSKSEFNRLRQKNKLLEWARVFNHYYGTPRDFVLKRLSEGKDVLLIIDVQGAMQIKRSLPEAILIFIAPPSYQSLRERMKKRGLDTCGAIEERLRQARREMAYIKTYDYAIINDKISMAGELLRSIITAERCRINSPRRYVGAH